MPYDPALLTEGLWPGGEGLEGLEAAELWKLDEAMISAERGWRRVGVPQDMAFIYTCWETSKAIGEVGTELQ